MLTVFTPTYNRVKTLPRLFESLKKQNRIDFEWLVIDDGSKDSTSALFEEWQKMDLPFPIRYFKKENGGKLRALIQGINMAQGEYFLILDSDDMLVPTAVESICKGFESLPKDIEDYIGIAFVRGDLNGKPLYRVPKIDPAIGYIDCNNLERPKYDLQSDMAEVFFTEKLKKYEFSVWPGEKFTPEEVVWNQMALDGYKLRWYDKVEYLCEYQPDGLTNSTWKLLRDNPMGYAMMFNHHLLYSHSLKERVNNVLQFISCCCLAKEYGYTCKCNEKLLAFILFLIGWGLSLRRKQQIKANCR